MNHLTLNAETAGAAAQMPAYPLSILIGCAALDEIDAFFDLPDGYWRVLARLVKKISVATPSQAIFARRETLARESGKSVETVGRALRWLEDHEFITREQKARAGLRGSEARIHPTKKLIDALGIGQRRNATRTYTPEAPLPAANDPTPELSTPSAVKNDGSISAKQVHSLLKKEQSDEPRASAGQKTKPAPSKSVVIDGKVIPADLGWMVKDRGMRVTGILKLMRLARNAKHRLSDIVALSWEALKPLRGNALFAYLCKLIMQDKDWTWLRKRNDKDAEDETKRQQDAELIARKVIEWQGHRYVSRDQQRIWIVESSGMIVLHGANASRRMDRAFVDAVMEGNLRRMAA
ncbi:hypothetical protein RHDC4_00742 [Rhodocyclaceae bacterium]|nr:hypothetical protein RHDC4_00742 [Rhodocyclaceae bacterium]